MLESYSDRALHVVSLATTEARRLGHPHVGTEHLLLGLLADEDDGPADVLRSAGATLAAARHKVTEVVGGAAGAPEADALPFTPRAQRALERAGRFSRQDREPEVTAEHLLLGVLDVEGLACQVLRGLGVDTVRLRGAVVASRDGVVPVLAGTVLADAVLADAVPADEPPPEAGAVRPSCPQCRAALDATLAETVVVARGDGERTTDLTVAYCAACGATIGVVRAGRSRG